MLIENREIAHFVCFIVCSIKSCSEARVSVSCELNLHYDKWYIEMCFGDQADMLVIFENYILSLKLLVTL